MLVDSAKLKSLRERKKLSQTELAEHLNLSQTTIYEWEKQDRNIKLEHALKIGEILDCDINDLAKDGTTININNQNNNKISSYAVVGVGSEINIEAYQLQKDLIDNLKKQINYLESELRKQKS